MRTALHMVIMLAAPPVVGQPLLLDSLLARNAYVIERNGSTLSGSGTAYLMSACKEAQFVLIGENHNTKEIPEFTAALFGLLNTEYGFEHLALEQDPAMMRILCDRERNIRSLAENYPSGFTFITDEELGMIEQVRSVSKTRCPIWGCDQSFGAAHALAEMASSLRARGLASPELDSIREVIRTKERVRDLGSYHYMSELHKRDELLAAEASVPLAHRDRLAPWSAPLLLSDSIYTLIRERSYFEGRRIREEYMKRRFLEEYMTASEHQDQPKVLLKFGNYHLYDGFNPGSSVGSLGAFVRQLAFMNGRTTIAINALIYRNDASEWDYFAQDPAWYFLQRFADHASVEQWTLFDLRPLRRAYYEGVLEPCLPVAERRNWENLVHGYDMLLLIGNGTDGKATITNGEY